MFLKSTEKHKKWLNDGIMGDFLFSIFPILYMTATFFYNEKNLRREKIYFYEEDFCCTADSGYDV